MGKGVESMQIGEYVNGWPTGRKDKNERRRDCLSHKNCLYFLANSMLSFREPFPAIMHAGRFSCKDL